jgi:hypothetical protein
VAISRCSDNVHRLESLPQGSILGRRTRDPDFVPISMGYRAAGPRDGLCDRTSVPLATAGPRDGPRDRTSVPLFGPDFNRFLLNIMLGDVRPPIEFFNTSFSVIRHSVDDEKSCKQTLLLDYIFLYFPVYGFY